MKKIVFISAFSLLFVYAEAQTKYHVLKTFSIASSGKWDYIAINPVSDDIYVSHATQVNVLNTKGDSIGVIENTTGVHGIAFAPAYGKGFTSNGKINTVTVFDIKTNAVQAQIKTGENPDAIMYDGFSKKIITCNGKSKDLSIIDPATNAVIATVALGGKPETAVSDEAGNIYVNLEDKNEIVKIDAKGFTVEGHWPIGAEGPTGLAIDTKTKRLFAGCEKMLVVVNANTGKVVANVPIGEGCDGTAFDPELKEIFASNGEGTLSVIREKTADKYEVVENAPTLRGARTLAVNTKTHLIYLPTADFKPMTEEDKGKHQRPEMIPGTFKVLVVGK